jgi:hypothetical protein
VTPRRPARSILRAALLSLVTAGILALGTNIGATSGSHDSRSSKLPTPEMAVPLLPGNNGAAALAVDPSHRGVWFLSAGSSTDVAVFFWNAQNHVLHKYLIPDPQRHNVSFGLFAGLAVARDGTVWVGAGSTLVSIDEKSGATSFATPPQPGPANTSAAIKSLAVGPAGQLAIAYQQSSYVDVRSASGTYTTLTIPNGASPQPDESVFAARSRRWW